MTTDWAQDAPPDPMLALARELWEKGDFDNANRILSTLPEGRDRVDWLTGRAAHGQARVPGTDFDADVALSHGEWEDRPTSLMRWNGKGPDGAEHRPTLKIAKWGTRLAIPIAQAPEPGPNGERRGGFGSGSTQGGEMLVTLLALREGDRIEIIPGPNGEVILRRVAGKDEGAR